MTSQLIHQVFDHYFHNDILATYHDGAILPAMGERIAMSTDTFVVTPLFFPGGNIGDLAINGTVNDILCCGATPRYLSAAFVIEEGMKIDDLCKIAAAMAAAAKEAEVEIVTGDTKVVERGRCDGVYINTTGIGIVPPNLWLDPSSLKPGDAIILTGPIGNHGMAIMTQREGLKMTSEIKSDSASLGDIVHALLRVVDLRVLRDPTRGGLAATLNELAEASGVNITIEETAIPLREDVRTACDLLGLDPLHVANEGIMVAVVPADQAATALEAVKRSAHGAEAAIIGTVEAPDPQGAKVWLRLPYGNRRRVEQMRGEQLPRIC